MHFIYRYFLAFIAKQKPVVTGGRPAATGFFISTVI